ncbi:hypothetical protein SBA2_630003 [Acidobacteriia bacterium SbA2]|nr:hypothetical protein SBA2_630003 [Acidobacteriia bacterium SbA2]
MNSITPGCMARLRPLRRSPGLAGSPVNKAIFVYINCAGRPAAASHEDGVGVGLALASSGPAEMRGRQAVPLRRDVDQRIGDGPESLEFEALWE